MKQDDEEGMKMYTNKLYGETKYAADGCYCFVGMLHRITGDMEVSGGQKCMY